MTLLAPGDELDVAPMINWSLSHDGPVAIRYPKAHRGKSIEATRRSNSAKRK